MNRTIRQLLCFAAVGLAAAACSFAQDTATPRAHTATNRSFGLHVTRQ